MEDFFPVKYICVSKAETSQLRNICNILVLFSYYLHLFKEQY